MSGEQRLVSPSERWVWEHSPQRGHLVWMSLCMTPWWQWGLKGDPRQRDSAHLKDTYRVSGVQTVRSLSPGWSPGTRSCRPPARPTPVSKDIQGSFHVQRWHQRASHPFHATSKTHWAGQPGAHVTGAPAPCRWSGSGGGVQPAGSAAMTGPWSLFKGGCSAPQRERGVAPAASGVAVCLSRSANCQQGNVYRLTGPQGHRLSGPQGHRLSGPPAHTWKLRHDTTHLID